MNKHLKNLGLPEFDSHPVKLKGECVIVEHNKLYDFVFQTDPATGLPANNIGLVMSRNIDPSLKNAILSELAVVYPNTQGAPSDDIAFDMIVPLEVQSVLGRNEFNNRVNRIVKSFENKKVVEKASEK